VSAAGIASNRWLGSVQQRATHAHLSQDLSQSPAPPPKTKRAHLDALIVPASRPASFLQPVIELAAFLGVFIVVLCSKQANAEHVAKRVARTPGARALIAPIPQDWSHSNFPTRTSAVEFRSASAQRRSDLSAKRNLGLLLARLQGWSKIAFVDDDIRLPGVRGIARLVGQLGQHPVAGMVVRRHPDNSVVCHARRLAGFAQDVFVTGAVLGVHCNSLPISFFPDIYNEDWFFFAREVAARKLPRVGSASQFEYDPFASPDRARREEFGDLLAEGLYALIGEEDPCLPFDEQLRAATTTYWSRFIDARRGVLAETMTVLWHFLSEDADNGRVLSALASLAAAESQLDTITPDLCANFIDAWRDDLDDWHGFYYRLNSVRNMREAMDLVELESWTLVE
jgi:hypothetical protein